MLKLVLLVLLVVLAVAVVRSLRRGARSSDPAVHRAKAATDQAVIGRQGHDRGWSGGGGS